MLRVHLLGQFHIFHDAQPLKLSAPPKTLPLLAFLLLHSEHPIPRETLAFTLWPDETEADARANVRRHLYHLIRALPPTRDDVPWLILDAETAQWNPQADYWLDVAEFKRLSQANAWAEAVELYGGDLLENVYDDWLFYPREQLRTLYFADLNQLILHCRAERDYGRAIEYARRLLAHDPLREDTVRQLMMLHYEAGDRASALREYEQFARRLRQELAVEPMPETMAVYESIVRNARLPTIEARPTTKDAADVTLRHPLSAVTLPFVGRDAAMGQLRAAWSRAARQRGGFVLIGGESGIGKTRLVSELAQVVEAQGGRVLWGSASPDAAPYQAIAAALRSALPLVIALAEGTTTLHGTSVLRKDASTESLWLAVIASLVPELRARVPHLPTLVPLDPEREHARLFEALACCLEGLAQPRPLLLVLDDLHWAGAATLAWLEFLAPRLAHWPVLVVGTYREEEATRDHPLRALRRRLQQANLVSHLALGQLDASAIQKIAERFVPDASRRAEFAESLYATSEGNPFFVSELIREWMESGKTLTALHAPPTIEATIAGRLARLSPAANALCEIASVIGTAFDTDLVRAVAGWSEAQTLDALDELLDHQLVREAGGRSRFDYVFTHHLIQSTVYATLSADTRTRRHRRIAHVMTGLGLPDEAAGELAMHWDRGGEPERAAENYWRAARYALALYADDEALAHLARALELTTQPHLQLQLLGLRETIWARRGEREAQYDDLVRLRQLAQHIGDEDLICDALRREIRYQRALGDRQAEAKLIESLHARVAPSGNGRWQAEVLREQATLQISLGQYDAAMPLVERALNLYQSLDDAAGQVQCLCLRVEIELWQGRFDAAQISLGHARALSQVHTNQSLLVQTWRAASAAAFTKQDFRLANDLAQQMLDLSQRIGDLEGQADALTRLGTIETRLFQIESARERYRQAEDLYRRLGKKQGQAAVLINAGLLAANRLGRYTEGLEQFRRAEKIFVEMNDARGQLVCALNIGMSAFFLGAFADAKAAAQHGLALARQMNSPMMEANALANLGAAERELGELDQAIADMQAGLAIRRTLGQPSDLGTDLCDLALAYLRAGKLDAARESAEEMLTLYATARDVMMRGEYMLWVAAQIYHALGDHARARDLLAQAHALLLEKAAAIPDAESRASFLQYPFNREILAAYKT